MKAAIAELSLFERVRQGLEDCLQFVRGERKLRTFVVVKAPPQWDAAEIQRFRRRRGMTQGQLACLLNVSMKTVRSWERGRRRPTQAALRLFQLLKERPECIDHILSGGSAKTVLKCIPGDSF